MKNNINLESYMSEIQTLENIIQEYSWGSKTAISSLLGKPTPSKNPQAEMWMGAHSLASSKILDGKRWVPLAKKIEKNPDAFLGKEIARKFEGKLPFLFKLLAAHKPLSIQAHPNIMQAKEGFLRENAAGIPLDARERNYKDQNHKPEIICALTPFWALTGFRKVDDIISIFNKVNIPQLLGELNYLRDRQNKEGLKLFFQDLMTMSQEKKQKVVSHIVQFAKRYEDQPIYHWILELNKEFPGDIGVISPLFLNLVKLQAGEAIFLPSRKLHAYLKGFAIELMANSDNVLRGGLTHKHVDVGELLKILSFKETNVKIIKPQSISEIEHTYQIPIAEFALSLITIDIEPYISQQNRSAEIMICLDGEAIISNTKTGVEIPFYKGISVIIPACVDEYKIEGSATIYKAEVPANNR